MGRRDRCGAAHAQRNNRERALVPVVLPDHGLEIFGELRVVPDEPLDLLETEGAHGQPELERSERSAKGNL